MYAFSMHQRKGQAAALHSLPVHVMRAAKEERGARRRARLCNTFAQEVDSVEQNGEG